MSTGTTLKKLLGGRAAQPDRSTDRVPGRGRERLPDIVLVMTDQQRHDQTGYASGGHFETPAIDRWAAQAVRFDQAHSASTTCVPARVSLLTGIDAHRVPVLDDGFTMREGFWTVAHGLRRAGYQTALVGKMHFIPHDADQGFDTMRTCEHLFPADFEAATPPPSGFDHYHDWLVEQGVPDWRATLYDPRAPGDPRFPLDARYHPTNWIADQAVDVLERRDPDRPLFLVVSFPHPHEPHNPPEPYASMFARDDVRLPADGFEVNDGLPEDFLEAMTVKAGVWGAARVPSEAFLREYLSLTRGLIRHIDDAAGRVLDRIDRSRTVTFFTSDHGDYGGHRGLIRKIPWIPFEDLTHVPLVIDAPDAVAGRVVPSAVSTADFALTCLDYAGVDIDPWSFDSRSLRPLLTGRDTAADRERTLVHSPNSGWPTIRRGPFKLITRPHYLWRSSVLFDLETDPGETTDLKDDARHRKLARDLENELLARLFRPVASPPPVDRDEPGSAVAFGVEPGPVAPDQREDAVA